MIEKNYLKEKLKDSKFVERLKKMSHNERKKCLLDIIKKQQSKTEAKPYPYVYATLEAALGFLKEDKKYHELIKEAEILPKSIIMKFGGFGSDMFYKGNDEEKREYVAGMVRMALEMYKITNKV